MKKLLQTKLQSATFRKSLYGIGATVIALMIFQAGMFVGERKAAFSYRFGDNYFRNFGEHDGKRGAFGLGKEGRFPEAHGAMGKILSVTPPTLMILGRDNIEKVILVDDKTMIKHFRDDAMLADLKVDDFIVVIGTPNDMSQIEAKLIRILPPPPELRTSTTTSVN
jgi:hypothetical protein